MSSQKWVWTSYGGCSTVTGSQHLLSTPTGKILLECGLFQGRRSSSRESNKKLSYKPNEIDALVLSHAHIDHSGKIPYLVKKGFNKKIYCTSHTAQLIGPLLHDCAHLMKDDYRYLKKKKRKVFEPLYNVDDVNKTLDLLEPVSYNTTQELLPHIFLNFHRAAHILGSAMVELSGCNKKIGFTGDLGPDPSPFLLPRGCLEDCQHLFVESTYGGRLHKPIEENFEDLRLEISRVQMNGGKIIIPAFAMERTQHLVALLNHWIEKKTIEPIDIYMDSPLGIRLTKIYESAQNAFCHPFKINKSNPFKRPWLHVMESVDQSISINSKPGPMVIISSSGMCEGGRILHHLKNNCSDSKNTILIVGFQAQHTLGRRIVERSDTIKIYGVEYPLKCRVKALNGFSAHADQKDLVKFVKSMGVSLKSVNIVHGEEGQRNALKNELLKEPLFTNQVDVNLIEEKIPQIL